MDRAPRSWRDKPTWQWTPDEHRLAFEAFQRRQGANVLANLARTRGLLWNRNGNGYGGGAWPFDLQRALNEPGYCKGVVNASKSPQYDSVWRRDAKDLLVVVQERLEQLVGAYNDMLDFKDAYGF